MKNFNLLKPERGPSEFLFATCRKHVCLLWLLETRNSRPSLLRSGSQVYFSLREFHVKYAQLILQKRVCVCVRALNWNVEGMLDGCSTTTRMR